MASKRSPTVYDGRLVRAVQLTRDPSIAVRQNATTHDRGHPSTTMDPGAFVPASTLHPKARRPTPHPGRLDEDSSGKCESV